MHKIPAALALTLLLSVPGAAQHRPGHHHAPPAADPARPYGGFETRRIKALSPEQEADLLAGRGMALALAAELNGYPGPMHVLEHAAALRLSPAQQARAEALTAGMRAEAAAIGARILRLEAELDALFARGAADRAGVAALAAEIGAASGELRAVHLVTHVGMRAALSASQLAEYDRLRGYARR